MPSISSKFSTRWFRATFLHAAYLDSSIVIEFEAPFPVHPGVDYEKLAMRAFEHEVAINHIKIRDVEPIEINPRESKYV